MCGLFGAISSSLTPAELENVQLLGYISALRGAHSTGMAIAGRRKKNKLNFSIRKDIVPAHAFVNTPETEKWLYEMRPFLVEGHCRHATLGAINHQNAHPIQEQHIIGCHNGTVYRFAPTKAEEDHTSDSRRILQRLGEVGAVQTLQECEHGAFALTWIDIRDSTFNLIRNDKRPLWIMRNIAGNTTYWASEKAFLDLMRSQNPTGAFQDPTEVPVDTLHQWRLGQVACTAEKLDIRSPIIPFVATARNSGSRGAVTRGEKKDWAWCPDCHRRSDFCTCTTIDAEVLAKDIIKSLDRDIEQTPLPLRLQDARPYRAFKGEIVSVHKILGWLRCWNCRRVQAPTDRVFWTDLEQCVCDVCWTTDPMVKGYYHESTVWQGGLVSVS